MPEENDVMPEKKWIAQLIQPGTSLGGARPKAGVLGEKGCLWVERRIKMIARYDADKSFFAKKSFQYKETDIIINIL